MAEQAQETAESGLDRLREEMADYVAARIGILAEQTSDKLLDVTDRLTDAAADGGTLTHVAAGLCAATRLSGQHCPGWRRTSRTSS
ncbi:hypothetical protein ACWD4K_30515 [Streptomyces gelaticus]